MNPLNVQVSYVLDWIKDTIHSYDPNDDINTEQVCFSLIHELQFYVLEENIFIFILRSVHPYFS